MRKLEVPGEIDASHRLYGAKGTFDCRIGMIDVDVVLGITASVIPPQVDRIALKITAGQVSIEIKGLGPILTPIVKTFARALGGTIADQVTNLLESALQEPLLEWLNRAIREAWAATSEQAS